MSERTSPAEAIASGRSLVHAYVALACLIAFALLAVARWQNHELRERLDRTRARLHRWAHGGETGLAQ